jgi:hypothetical protein
MQRHRVRAQSRQPQRIAPANTKGGSIPRLQNCKQACLSHPGQDKSAVAAEAHRHAASAKYESYRKNRQNTICHTHCTQKVCPMRVSAHHLLPLGCTRQKAPHTFGGACLLTALTATRHSTPTPTAAVSTAQQLQEIAHIQSAADFIGYLNESSSQITPASALALRNRLDLLKEQQNQANKQAGHEAAGIAINATLFDKHTLNQHGFLHLQQLRRLAQAAPEQLTPPKDLEEQQSQLRRADFSVLLNSSCIKRAIERTASHFGVTADSIKQQVDNNNDTQRADFMENTLQGQYYQTKLTKILQQVDNYTKGPRKTTTKPLHQHLTACFRPR